MSLAIFRFPAVRGCRKRVHDEHRHYGGTGLGWACPPVTNGGQAHPTPFATASVPLLAIILLSSACSSGGGGSSSSSASSSTTTTPPTTTVTVPGAPTIATAIAGNRSASIAFTAPNANGGAAITAYTASCSAFGGNVLGTASASPVTVNGLTNATTYSCTVTATNSAGVSAASAAVSVTPAAPATTTTAIDPTRLPIGDTKTTTTTPQVGYLFACTVQSGGGGASSKGPWFNADGTTWNSTTKIAVQGVVNWVSTFLASLANSTLSVSGNGLPSHSSGTYPIASSDPAYAYDRNPNTIAAQTIAWGLPGNPQVATSPTCLNGGAIGVLLTGARMFNALDAENRDAVAWEMQDSCQGHPERSGAYHYHNVSSCVTKDTVGQHSPLVGYAADGFGIYGNLGVSGAALTNADLDLCHGHSHAVTVNGQTVTQYHYHATKEFPYSLGCYKGTPVKIS